MVRILDIGSGPDKRTIEERFEFIKDKEILRLDINEADHPDIVHDIAVPLEGYGQFDIVHSSHMVEHVDRDAVVRVFRNMAALVKPMGEMWVFTPSLEWAANEILAHRDGMHIQALLYGGQQNIWDYHRCGYTLKSLRTVMEAVGLTTKKAAQATFLVGFAESGKTPAHVVQCIQNFVIGAKFPRPGPEDAIS